VHNLARLPQLQSLALPQQLLCPGCYPGLEALIAQQLVPLTSLTKLVFLNVDNDRHADRISMSELCRQVAEATRGPNRARWALPRSSASWACSSSSRTS